MAVEATKKKLSQLIEEIQQFIVPSYQREYVWHVSREVEDFWDDLYDQIENYKKNPDDMDSAELFLGNIILCPSANFNADQKNSMVRVETQAHDIVDGQQRITTIFIFFLAFKKWLLEIIENDELDIEDKAAAKRTVQQMEELICKFDRNTAKTKGHRLKAASNIEPIMDYILDPNWKFDWPMKLKGHQIKRVINKVQPIYNYFLKALRKKIKPKEYHTVNTVLLNIAFIRTLLKDYAEAFIYFERTNSRGKDLEVGDLLKATIFANWDYENKDDIDIIKMWDDIVENTKNKLGQSLRYFYMSHHGHITTGKLYNAMRNFYDVDDQYLKEYKNKSKQDRYLHLVLELEKFTSFFQQITDVTQHDQVNKIFSLFGAREKGFTEQERESIMISMRGLNLFKVTQTIPLIYAFLEKFYKLNMHKIDQYKPKVITNFFETLENYHFINNYVSTNVGHKVEHLYPEYAKNICRCNNVNSFIALLNDFYKELKTSLTDKDVFVGDFIQIAYSGSNQNIRYIYDKFNGVDSSNNKVSPTSRKHLFQPGVSLKKLDSEIEHWYPISKSKNRSEITDDGETIEVVGKKEPAWVHSIGNLIIINGLINNMDLNILLPSHKCEVLKTNTEKNTLPYNQRFIKEYDHKEWDERPQEFIESRSKKLADEAYNIIWKFQPDPLLPEGSGH